MTQRALDADWLDDRSAEESLAVGVLLTCVSSKPHPLCDEVGPVPPAGTKVPVCGGSGPWWSGFRL